MWKCSCRLFFWGIAHIVFCGFAGQTLPSLNLCAPILEINLRFFCIVYNLGRKITALKFLVLISYSLIFLQNCIDHGFYCFTLSLPMIAYWRKVCLAKINALINVVFCVSDPEHHHDNLWSILESFKSRSYQNTLKKKQLHVCYYKNDCYTMVSTYFHRPSSNIHGNISWKFPKMFSNHDGQEIY